MMSMSCEKKMRAIQIGATCSKGLSLSPINPSKKLASRFASGLGASSFLEKCELQCWVRKKKAAEELPVAITTHR
jgi:hypothetical protein